jgi:hypothetical protein
MTVKQRFNSFFQLYLNSDKNLYQIYNNMIKINYDNI